MARTKIDAIRLGPVTLTGGSVEETLGSIPLSTITQGLTDGQQVYVDAIIILFVSHASAYSAMVTATASVRFGTGPTYDLGNVSRSEINATGAGDVFTGEPPYDLDIDSGNLRVRVTVDGGVGFAIVNLVGP